MRAEHFRRVIVKPNQQEAEAASLRALGRVDYPELRRRMAGSAPDRHARRRRRLGGGRIGRALGGYRQAVANPVDICGAGDSFSAGAALALRVDRRSR